MSKKKLFLLVILGFLSSIFALSLGGLDFYGFFDERQTLNLSLILLSISLSYAITIVIFLLDYSDHKDLFKVFSLVSALFAVFFFLVNTSFISTIVTTAFFIIFLCYTYKKSLSRSKLYVKFSPNDIFMPVVKNAFVLLLVLFACFSFMATKNLLTEKNELTPQLLKIASRPIVTIINKQLSNQIQPQIQLALKNSSFEEREKATHLVLQQMIEAIDEKKSQELFGVKPHEIPIEKTIVKQNGDIDISLVADDIVPFMSININKKYASYVGFTPFIVALLAALLLQSIVWPFQLVAGFVTPFVFWLLIKIGFVSKAYQNVEAEVIKL